jgi:ketosteroid isomerase-like protein
MASAREAVEEHVAAFNAHDTARVLAGFAPDAVWATGQDVVRGSDSLAELFDAGLWQLEPSLHVLTLLGEETLVAAELHETITVEGARHDFRIAVFFTVEAGLIQAAKVYREGSADID